MSSPKQALLESRVADADETLYTFASRFLSWFFSCPPTGHEAEMLRNASPVSVISSPTPPARGQTPTATQLAAHALSCIYASLANHGCWDTSFHKGARRHHGVRSLATRYLSSSTADGWNVVTGALLLARVWAVRETTTCTPTLDRSTRLRLAVCLSVSWKFQRGMATNFPRMFGQDGTENGLIPHRLLTGADTLELAHLATGFLYDAEKDTIGEFVPQNAAQLRNLYRTMVALEVNLIRTVAVFGILTDNAQVGTEYLAEDMVVSKNLTAERALLVRSMVPFFVRAAVCGPTAGRSDALFVELMDPTHESCKGVEHSAASLFAASYFCICAGTASRPTLTFSTSELETASSLLSAALHGRDAEFLFSGFTPSNPFVGTRSLLEARRAAVRALEASSAA